MVPSLGSSLLNVLPSSSVEGYCSRAIEIKTDECLNRSIAFYGDYHGFNLLREQQIPIGLANEKTAHLATLSTPGSGLLHLDETIIPVNPGCCSLPTQPADIVRSGAQSSSPNPPSLETSTFDSGVANEPTRVYGSDRSLSVSV